MGEPSIFLDPYRVTEAFTAVADFTDRPLVLFEFLVDEVMTTTYQGEATERRRWRAASMT